MDNLKSFIHSLGTFFRDKFKEVLFFVFIFPFSIYMIYLGMETIRVGHELYAKSISGSLKVKAMIPCTDCIKFGYSQSVTYFMLAIGAFLVTVLLPKIQSITFAGASIVLQALEKKVDALGEQNNGLQEKLVNGAIGGNPLFPPVAAHHADALKGGQDQQENADWKNLPLQEPESKLYSKKRTNKIRNVWKDDPQKGKWGGFSDANGRHLSAIVGKTDDRNIFKVQLTVVGEKDKPLTGLVKFHLHPTFKDPTPVITASNNRAELKLSRVWGAFTVGVETDGGRTKLELDLATLADAPEIFKSR